jgi:uncharacterized lipoprotein YmbA
MHPRRATIAWALALPLLTACASSPPTSFYTLASLPAETIAAAKLPTATVAIGPVALPDYLDRPQIVTRDSAYSVRLATFDNWAGPLADMLPRVLVEDLALRLPGDRVAGFPQVSGSSFDYRVAVDVLRFDVDTGGTAMLVANWQVYDRVAPRAVLVADATFTQPGIAGDHQAGAAALSSTLAQLSDRIAADVASVRVQSRRAITPTRPPRS